LEVARVAAGAGEAVRISTCPEFGVEGPIGFALAGLLALSRQAASNPPDHTDLQEDFAREFAGVDRVLARRDRSPQVLQEGLRQRGRRPTTGLVEAA
jgi:hypothetical protein